MGRGERDLRNQSTQEKQSVAENREALKQIKDKADQLNRELKRIMNKGSEKEDSGG